MAEYIEREALIATIRKELNQSSSTRYCCEDGTIICTDVGYVEEWFQEYVEVLRRRNFAADVAPVVHGEWLTEVHSFYADTWDESCELVIYILAKCSECDEKHPNCYQVFSKHLYAPEDANDDFCFDEEAEKEKALAEFVQSGYNNANYCQNCGAKMDGE